MEPSTCLVNCLWDKLGRELLLKYFLVLEWIVVLCKWHGSWIKPAVKYLRYTVHILATLRTLDCHSVDVWSVKLYLCCLWISCFFSELCTASDTLSVSAFTLPDIEWCAPVTVTWDSPILYILKPVSETSWTDRLRNPVYCIVVSDKIILYCCLLDVPWLSCIVDKRLVTSPAVWILMLKFRSIEKLLSAA